MIEGLAHIGIAVQDIDEAISFFKNTFGAELVNANTDDGKMNFGLHISAMVKMGTLTLELMQATQEGVGPVGKFIAAQGEGLHHVSLKVNNFAEARDAFEKKDLKIMGEIAGVMAFIHPSTCKGVLVEFTEVA